MDPDVTLTVFGDAAQMFVVNDPVLVLSDAEAAELYRYTRHDYINPNTFPHLLKLLARIEHKVKA